MRDPGGHPSSRRSARKVARVTDLDLAKQLYEAHFFGAMTVTLCLHFEQVHVCLLPCITLCVPPRAVPQLHLNVT
jgi:hypothetical protein